MRQKNRRIECCGAHMYDEVENETNCIGPHVGELNVVEPICMMRWKMSLMRTCQYYVSLSTCRSTIFRG